jgi:hypothetical protein
MAVIGRVDPLPLPLPVPLPNVAHGSGFDKLSPSGL